MHLQYRERKKVWICITLNRMHFNYRLWAFFLNSVSVSLTSRCEVTCQNTVNSWQAWVGDNWMRSVVVHCLHQFPAALLVFHHSHACRTDHILKPSTTRHKRLCRKLWPFFFFFILVMTVLNQFLPPALSWLTIGCLLKKVKNPARNLPAPVEGQDLARHQWKMLPSSTEGLKLDDTESRAVICPVCTEFCRSSTRWNRIVLLKKNHCQCV